MGPHEMSYIPNAAGLEFIRKSYDHCAAFLNICGGGLTAGMAGVLKGKTCTAPQAMLGMLRQQFLTMWVAKR